MEKKRKKSATRKLLVANLIAFALFIGTLLFTLWALGLLQSVFRFLF